MPVKYADFKVYLITDRRLFRSIDAMMESVESALAAGVMALQIREKDLPSGELLELAKEMRALTLRYNATLFINDRVDIALCSAADGVHIGGASMPIKTVRDVAGSDLLIGYSAHSVDDAKRAAMEGADFLTFGPVFETPSKMMYGRPVGLEELSRACKEVSLPIFGIGGIKTDNAAEVIEAGAAGIALISGILGAKDSGAAARGYLTKIGEER